MSGQHRGAKLQTIYVLRTALNRMGFDLIREPFRHRFLHALRTHGVEQVLDIGANTGQFGSELRRAGFTGRIVSVEPLSAACAELRAVAAKDPDWSVEQAAVSSQTGTLEINVAGNSVSSSVLPMLDRHARAAPDSQYVTTELVRAATVDELVAQHGLEPERALLKLDVQGYELTALDGAGATLGRFAAVRTEMSLVALYEGQALMPDIVGRLAAHGLDLWHVQPGFVEPATRRLLQLDGIFVRGREG